MSSGISPVEDIKQKLAINEVLQEYIQLHKAGTNYKALCPFHREKTPSFVVSPEKQIFHCFGCGEGGDIFAFVQKMEGVEFPEALRILAQKAGVKLTPRNPELHNQRTKLMDINKLAASYYHKVLLEAQSAKVVRDYLVEREVSDEAIENFKLGFAPEEWERLNDFLKKKGYKEADIFASGLTIKSDKGVGQYDRFRNRLMFPINDLHSNTVGFTGRILDDQKEAAKYVNTPQTLIYNKSQILYGLDKAKQEVKKEKLAVIVEGNMDVLASHQAGVLNVVASSGTSLTEGQINIIKRYTDNIAIAFDADLAGEGAAKRGIELAMQAGLNVRVITLPYGKDPDECIKKDVQLWKEAIVSSQTIMDYYLDTTLDKLDLNKVEDKKEAAKILLPIINKIPDTIEQTHYLQELAGKLKVEEAILRNKIEQASSPEPKSQPAKTENNTTVKKDRQQQVSEEILGIALKYYENLDYIVDNCKPEFLTDPELQNLYKSLIIYYTEKHRFDPDEFKQSLAGKDENLRKKVDVLELLAENLYGEFEENMFKTELDNIIRFLNKNQIISRQKLIENQLKESEKRVNQDDKSKEKELLEEFDQLSKKLNHLE
ncbi:DNA primase [Patescibacteria group bacterium]|nr:DNA primase [Patescibacteria group bacterium]